MHSTAYLSLSALALAFLSSTNAGAASGIWLGHPVDNDWNNPLNWSSGTVPGFDDIASLSASDVTDLTIGGPTNNNGIIFNAGASSFTISPSVENAASILCHGDVVNNSGVAQNFVLESDSKGNGTYFTLLKFPDDPSAVVGSMITFTVKGSPSEVIFENEASAGEATYVNEAGGASGEAGGLTAFFGNAVAGDSTILNKGATVAGAGGGYTIFQQLHPAASNATLIAEGGSNGGGGGSIIFYDKATGNSARVELFGNGFFDISQTSGGAFTIGSLEGNGLVSLGRRSLSIGGLGLSTIFSGLMQDGGIGGGSSASVNKVGSGTLTLTGANTYSGGTTVDGGVLAVRNMIGSATGSGTVLVKSNSLGGSGTIAGPVTVGTGSGTGAFLAPAAGTKKQATLTIQSAVTFMSDATYTYTFKARRNQAKTDKVIANGVTINSGATFNFSGQTQGTLTLGSVLPVISNTAATPIAGTFSNLPDGAILTVNGNNFQASYEGGDGNELTLTVVP